MHRQRKRGEHVTLQLLHLEYKAVHLEGLSYTQFCVHYLRWRARQDVVMRLEFAAGERMFVDFAGDTVSVTDPETGEVVWMSIIGDPHAACVGRLNELFRRYPTGRGRLPACVDRIASSLFARPPDHAHR